MDGFQYRGKARIMAFVDVVFISMYIWKPVVLLNAAVFETSKNVSLKGDETTFSNKDLKNEMEASLIYMSFMFFVSLSFVIIQMVAVVKLLNATEIGLDPKYVRCQAGFWRTVTIVFTIPTILLVGIFEQKNILLIFYIPSIIIHCIGIYIVGRFISEAESTVMHTLLLSYRDHGDEIGFTIKVDVANNEPPAYEEVGKL